MKKCCKYILIFTVITALVLCPFSGCFALFADASFGAMWAIAESAGVSISSSGLSVGSPEWNDFNEELWGDLDIGNMNFLQSDGSITVSAEDYNAVLDRLVFYWGNGNIYQPPSLNVSSLPFVDYQTVYNGSSYAIVNYRDGVPFSLASTSTNYRVNDVTNRIWCDLGNVQIGDVITVPSISVPSILPRCYIYSFALINLDTQASIPLSGSFTANNSYSGHLAIDCYVKLEKVYNSTPTLAELSPMPISNIDLLSQVRLSSFVPPDTDISASFSVTPADIQVDGIWQTVQGKAAITSRKMHDVLNKTVTITPILPNGQKPLQGLPWNDVNAALEQGFFDSIHDVVATSIGEGVLNPSDEEDTPDLIYGEVSWIRRITQSIETKLDDIKEAIEEFFANQGSGTPVFPDEPPDFLGGGDGGLRFHISGIWHYVVSFVQSLGGAFTLFGSVWNGLPSAMFAAVYAAAVVVIVVGLFKRYIG